MIGPSVCLALCFTGLLGAENSAKGFQLELFDGKSLDGWVVTECQADVVDETLQLTSGNGFVRCEQTYSDFVLELDWRALKEDQWDSGIYFRAGLPKGKRPWPRRHQINLKKGQEGDLVSDKSATGKGLCDPKNWNKFVLTVVGANASLEINGQQAWSVDNIEPSSGYIGLQAEVPLGGKFQFRNIRITELNYRPLFNGRDLAGWEGGNGKASDCWDVENGELVCNGKKGPWLRSLEKFGDFNLRLEYLLRAGGNSGVYVRVPHDGNHHGKGAGVEIQILDDAAAKYKTLQPYQYCGSVYGISPSTEKVGLPPGRWNRLEINVAGPQYRVRHNGTIIVDASPEKFPKLLERLTDGYLGLQNHKERVAFRRLRIGPPQD